MTTIAREVIWEALGEIMDPEIPVISIVELGIVRGVELREEGGVIVTITPTFSGCPALEAMKQLVREKIVALGAGEPEVRLSLSPAWTTDWIDEEAREKLRKFGLAPPPPVEGDLAGAAGRGSACPYCGAERAEMKNAYGSTPCRAIYYCHQCRQPFEQFKPL